MGIVIKDCNDKVLACLNSFKTFYSQPIVAEFWALQRAMIFCTELGIENVHFEGDAHVLINALNCEDECFAWFGKSSGRRSKEEAKQFLMESAHWFITFVNREGNEPTHLLAKHSLTLYEESIKNELHLRCNCTRIENVPNVIADVVPEWIKKSMILDAVLSENITAEETA